MTFSLDADWQPMIRHWSIDRWMISETKFSVFTGFSGFRFCIPTLRRTGIAPEGQPFFIKV